MKFQQAKYQLSIFWLIYLLSTLVVQYVWLFKIQDILYTYGIWIAWLSGSLLPATLVITAGFYFKFWKPKASFFPKFNKVWIPLSAMMVLSFGLLPLARSGVLPVENEVDTFATIYCGSILFFLLLQAWFVYWLFRYLFDFDPLVEELPRLYSEPEQIKELLTGLDLDMSYEAIGGTQHINWESLYRQIKNKKSRSRFLVSVAKGHPTSSIPLYYADELQVIYCVEKEKRQKRQKVRLQKIRDLIGKNNLDMVMQQLEFLAFELDHPLVNVIVLAKARFEDLKLQELKGVIAPEERKLEYNRIRNILIEFVDQLLRENTEEKSSGRDDV